MKRKLVNVFLILFISIFVVTMLINAWYGQLEKAVVSRDLPKLEKLAQFTPKFLIKNTMGRRKGVRHRHSGGDSLLHKAIEVRDLKIMAFLIDQGADTQGRNYDYLTPLQLAVSKGFTDEVELLLQKGVSPEGVSAYSEKKTALFIAAEKLRTDIICLLLKYGADQNKKDARGQTVVDVVSNAKLFYYQLSDQEKNALRPGGLEEYNRWVIQQREEAMKILEDKDLNCRVPEENFLTK